MMNEADEIIAELFDSLENRYRKYFRINER